MSLIQHKAHSYCAGQLQCHFNFRKPNISFIQILISYIALGSALTFLALLNEPDGWKLASTLTKQNQKTHAILNSVILSHTWLWSIITDYKNHLETHFVQVTGNGHGHCQMTFRKPNIPFIRVLVSYIALYFAFISWLCLMNQMEIWAAFKHKPFTEL